MTKKHTEDAQKEAPWWRGAVIYQIYPRSFADSNGDGIGDLHGILAHLDHVSELGADAVWLSPVHPSPDRDFGYDVSDYRSIHPKLGTMADFDRLLADVHKRGMKLILDEVLSHTSDEHPWFHDSVVGGEAADWYVWAPPRPDGTSPNNWLSAFGGPAWSYHPARRRYYHHKFLRQQPKLNLHHPAVRAAALEVLRFWLDKGVDGFRLDVANSYLHDRTLSDNPPVPEEARTDFHWEHAPRLQDHRHDANRAENAEMLACIRAVMDAYPGSFAFGEFSEAPDMIGLYASGPKALHSGYTFDFIDDTSFAPEVFNAFYGRLAEFPNLWPCVTFSNHDAVRTVTRYGRTAPGQGSDPRLAKLALALLVCLKGTVLLYQGEELGLDQADIADRDLIRDPVGDLYYPFFKGRDGCRTPMPWRAGAPNLGFTTGPPWLPLSPSHQDRAVNLQEADPDSVLHFARQAIALRQRHKALRLGALHLLPAAPGVLAFERVGPEERLVCLFNLGGRHAPASWPKADVRVKGTGGPDAAVLLEGEGGLRRSGTEPSLAPLGFVVLKTA